MIKKFDAYNESLRDKMVARSFDEVIQPYKKLLKDLLERIPKNKFMSLPDNVIEYKKISELLDTPVNHLYMASPEESDFNIIDKYMDFLSYKPKELKEIKIENETYKNDGGEWYCIPDLKIAYWKDQDYDMIQSWIVSGDVLNLINESLRDMMKPKSKEEMKKVVSEMPTTTALMKSIELNYPDIFKETLNKVRELSKEELNQLLKVSLYYDSIDIVKYLVDEVGLKLKTGSLVDAAERGYLDLVKYLVEEKNHKIDLQDNLPLAKAIRNNNKDVAKYLLSKGATLYSEEVEKAIVYSRVVDYNTDYLNEGIIDHMTPKSEKQLKNAFMSLFNKIDPTPYTSLSEEGKTDVEKISDVLECQPYDLYTLAEEDDDYDTMYEVFETLVIGRETSKSLVKVESGDYTYNIYTDIQMALGSPDDFNNLNVLIFNWSFLRRRISNFERP